MPDDSKPYSYGINIFIKVDELQRFISNHEPSTRIHFCNSRIIHKHVELAHDNRLMSWHLLLLIQSTNDAMYFPLYPFGKMSLLTTKHKVIQLNLDRQSSDPRNFEISLHSLQMHYKEHVQASRSISVCDLKQHSPQLFEGFAEQFLISFCNQESSSSTLPTHSPAPSQPHLKSKESLHTNSLTHHYPSLILQECPTQTVRRFV